MSTPQEHDYIGLSSSPPSEVVAAASSMKKTTPAAASLNLKETELRLGLPGSTSPDRNNNNNTNSSLGLFPFFGKNQNFVVSGAKRGFDDSSCEKWGFADLNGAGSDDDHHVDSKKLPPAAAVVKEVADLVKKKVLSNEHGNNAPAAKAQVVGWPPVRSFRKNTMATSLAKNNDEAECLYVKVSMDGAPYLRKVDLKTYSNYMELSSALEKMFSCFTIGQCGSHGNGMSESRLVDLLHGSESVLTYEDKDGDWMLVGDVPWQMFANSCRRLRIMKGSEAIGLAPRAMEKCKNRN